MNIGQIYDDMFTDDFLMESFIHFSEEIAWSPTNIANRKQHPITSSLSRGSHILMGAQLTDDFKIGKDKYLMEPVNRWMELYKPDNVSYQVWKVEANLQFMGMEGTWHRDHYYTENPNTKENTLLYYPHYKWNSEWGGPLEVRDNETQMIIPHEVKSGRMILIDSTMSHRARAPVTPYIYRMSIAYRMIREERDYVE